MITREKIEEAADDMCRFYCRFPLIWDEQMMGMELENSEICRNCPMSELIMECPIEKNPMGFNPYQE